MATTKRLIKNLKDSRNVDVLQVLKTFIYGDNELEVHRDNKVYKFDDFVIKYNVRTSRFETYRCVANNSSLIWVLREWKKENLISYMKNIENIVGLNRGPASKLRNNVNRSSRIEVDISTLCGNISPTGLNVANNIITNSVYNYTPSSSSIEVMHGNKLDHCIFI